MGYPSGVFFSYDLWILLAVFLLYFCNGGPEHWYVDYSYTYALCTRGFTKQLANTLVTIFWASMMVGRGSAIVLANYIQPKYYFTVNAVCCTITYVLLYIFWEADSPDWIIWFSTIVAGLNWATLDGCGVSWAAEYIKVTSKYAFVFSTGNFVGQAFAGPLSANLVNRDTQDWFMYALIYQCGIYIPIVFMFTIAPKMLSFQQAKLRI